MKLEATKAHVQAKHRMRRRAISSGKGKLGGCVHFDVSRNAGWKPSKEIMRLREIEKVIKSRHGSIIPDATGTDDMDLCMGYIRAAALSCTGQSMRDWCARFCPWIIDRWEELVSPILVQAENRRFMANADGVAGMIMVSMKERTSLGLKTIGACDVTTAERKMLAKERKRERDKNRQEQLRRAAGRIDRKSQQGKTVMDLKPWEDAGVSRATWYRRQRETALSQIEIAPNSDTRVSQLELPPTPPQIQTGQARVAGLVGGLGHHAPAGFQGAAPHGKSDTEEAA